MLKTISSKLNGKEKNYREVKIQVPWGFIAGKWWGPKSVRPILCLHGWQDNAGSFDTLIPLLPKHISFLAIDFPGHGFSSRYPHGMIYSELNFVYCLEFIRREYNWDTMSLMGHSMGGSVAYWYTSVYSDKVDLTIGLDKLKSTAFSPTGLMTFHKYNITNNLIADQRNQENSEPPSYKYNELIQRLNEGTQNSVTLETCKYILKRGIKKSKKYPSRYYFSRDSRLKYTFYGMDMELSEIYAKNIVTPYLYIKAGDNILSRDTNNDIHKIVNIIKEKNNDFHMYIVDGNHHVHLVNPDIVSTHVIEFLNKYRPIKTKL